MVISRKIKAFYQLFRVYVWALFNGDRLSKLAEMQESCPDCSEDGLDEIELCDEHEEEFQELVEEMPDIGPVVEELPKVPFRD